MATATSRSLDALVGAVIQDALDAGGAIANARFSQIELGAETDAVKGGAPASHPTHVLSCAIDYLDGWRGYLHAFPSPDLLEELLAIDLAVGTLYAWRDYLRREVGFALLALGQKSAKDKIAAGFTVSLSYDEPVVATRCEREECAAIVVGTCAHVTTVTTAAPTPRFRVARSPKPLREDLFVAIARERSRVRRAQREAAALAEVA